jgi:hypothetical protein
VGGVAMSEVKHGLGRVGKLAVPLSLAGAASMREEEHSYCRTWIIPTLSA